MQTFAMGARKMLASRTFECTIYCVKWLSDGEHCIIGGGGGRSSEISNRLYMCKLSKSEGQVEERGTRTSANQYQLDIVQQLDTGHEVVWTMSVCESQGLIAFCSVHQVHLVRFARDSKEQPFSLKLLDSKDLHTNVATGEKKFVSFASDNVLVANDDNNDILVFKIEDNGLQLVKSFNAHTKPLTDLEARGNKICTAGEDKLFKIWDLETAQCLYSFEQPYKQLVSHQFKGVKISNCSRFVYVMLTGKAGNSYILKFNLLSGKREFISRVHRKAATCIGLSHCQSDITFNPLTDDEYFGLGIAGSFFVKDARKSLRTYLVENKVFRDYPMTCCDLLVLERNDEKRILAIAGSLSRTVEVYETSARYSHVWSYFFLSFIVALLSIVYYYYFVAQSTKKQH